MDFIYIKLKLKKVIFYYKIYLLILLLIALFYTYNLYI